MFLFFPASESCERPIVILTCSLLSPPLIGPLFLGFRLGVGAPLPETSNPSRTRLVKKLEGGKRRAQQMENGTSASGSTSTMVQNNGGQEEEDSAEESRAGTIRKRERVDPFEPGKKKKKRRKNAEMEMDVEAVVTTAPPAKEDIVLEEAPQTGAMETVDTTTRPGPKKKKKKKKNAHEGHGVGGCVTADGGPAEVPSPNRGQNAEPSGPMHSVPDERDDNTRRQQGNFESSYSDRLVLPTDGGVQSPVVSPKPPRMSPLIQLPNTSKFSVLSGLSSPILNLTGPPAITPEAEASPHKKRKRKRKKKRTGDQGAGDDPP